MVTLSGYNCVSSLSDSQRMAGVVNREAPKIVGDSRGFRVVLQKSHDDFIFCIVSAVQHE